MWTLMNVWERGGVVFFAILLCFWAMDMLRWMLYGDGDEGEQSGEDEYESEDNGAGDVDADTAADGGHVQEGAKNMNNVFKKMAKDTKAGFNKVNKQVTKETQKVEKNAKAGMNKIQKGVTKGFNKVFGVLGCGVRMVSNRTCWMYWFLEMLGHILYIPFYFLAAVSKTARNFLKEIWKVVYLGDKYVYRYLGLHFAHFPKEIIQKCYKC